MEQYEESWFFHMVDRLQQQGYVGPGERVLKYPRKGDERERRRFEAFAARALEVCEYAFDGIPEDAAHDFAHDLPKAMMLRQNNEIWVATRGNELYGLALRELGRPRMQTMVQRP